MRFKSIIRYIVALSLIGFVAVAAYLSIRILIEEEKKSAAIINISGRQRMYSQRIALYLNKSNNSNQAKKEIYKKTIRELADSMETVHHLLLNGNKRFPAMRTDKIDAIYYKAPHNLNQRVQIFLEEIDTFLNSTDSLEIQKSTIIINDFAAEQLLGSLNEVVFEYQYESDKTVQKLENRVTLAVLLILMLIILEAIFIFYPLARLIQKHEKNFDSTKQTFSKFESRFGAVYLCSFP